MPMAILHYFIRGTVNSPGCVVLISSREPMTEISFFSVTALNEMSSTCLSLSGYLQAMLEPLQNQRLANDLLRQLMISVGSLEISSLSNLVDSNLTFLHLIWSSMYCNSVFLYLLVAFAKKWCKNCCAPLLISYTLRFVDDLIVCASHCHNFFHVLVQKCLWSIKLFNSRRSHVVEFLKFPSPDLTVWNGAGFSTIFSYLCWNNSKRALPFWPGTFSSFFKSKISVKIGTQDLSIISETRMI